jgi:hypothetical protein
VGSFCRRICGDLFPVGKRYRLSYVLRQALSSNWPLYSPAPDSKRCTLLASSMVANTGISSAWRLWYSNCMAAPTLYSNCRTHADACLHASHLARTQRSHVLARTLQAFGHDSRARTRTRTHTQTHTHMHTRTHTHARPRARRHARRHAHARAHTGTQARAQDVGTMGLSVFALVRVDTYNERPGAFRGNMATHIK